MKLCFEGMKKSESDHSLKTIDIVGDDFFDKWE